MLLILPIMDIYFVHIFKTITIVDYGMPSVKCDKANMIIVHIHSTKYKNFSHWFLYYMHNFAV